jgi:hypothetical protein
MLAALIAGCGSGYWGASYGYNSYDPYDYYDYDPYRYYSDCPRHWVYGPLDCYRCHW